jgi:hypothetical protein
VHPAPSASSTYASTTFLNWGGAKKQDLAYFLSRICGMGYAHLPVLAPTQDIPDRYKELKGNWQIYERDSSAWESGGSSGQSRGMC